MALVKSEFTLLDKRILTSDVFELAFEASISLESRAGEYVLFDIAPGIKRAYSIANRRQDGAFVFVIKRVEGGAGSPILCDAAEGAKFSTMGPMGHFTLRENTFSKCFLGTGTGFAPLYYQLLASAGLCVSKVAFAFGVRTFGDVFYKEEILDLSTRFDEFRFEPYLSREVREGMNQGYVVDFLTPQTVAEYQEFYICGSPAMVASCREKLEALDVSKDRIFFEQY